MGMERVVFFNGEFIPESEARISIYDFALMFGDMVFDISKTIVIPVFQIFQQVPYVI